MLPGRLGRGPLVRARGGEIDASGALALAGVRAVLTAADISPGVDEALDTGSGRDIPDSPRPPLAGGEARFVGDPVALVIATDRYIAEDAVDLVVVDYEPLAAVADYTEAATSSELEHDGFPGNSVADFGGAPVEAVAEVFASAAHVVEETIYQQAYAAVPLETRGMVAEWSPASDELTIWAATQAPHEVRLFCPRLLALPAHRVRVIIDRKRVVAGKR